MATPSKKSSKKGKGNGVDVKTYQHPAKPKNSNTESSHPYYYEIPRDWSARPDFTPNETIASTTTSGTSTAEDLTPMERWTTETSLEGPWNDVESVAYNNEHENVDFSAQQGGSTDAGTWYPQMDDGYGVSKK